MRLLTKTLPLLLITMLAASSLIAVESASAQSTPKPAVPEFTLQYSDHSHSVPPTYGTDPYTGKSVITNYGQDITNRTVQFTIKNQPFTRYTDSNGTPISLYYHIRYKGHYEDHWSGNYQTQDGSTTIYDTLVFQASNTTYTEISLEEYLVDGVTSYEPLNFIHLPDSGLVDFQVQAIIGIASVETLKTTYSDVGPFYGVKGQLGDWSPTQTITIGESSVSTATVNPTFPNLTAVPLPNSSTNISLNYSFSLNSDVFVIIIGVLVVVIIVLAMSLLYTKHKGAAKHE
jgi:hypothetical protein